MKKKEIILASSLNMFNERGSQYYSLRSVARKLNMSDGNLRYHYRTKEDIIVGIIDLLFLEFKNVLDRLGPEGLFNDSKNADGIKTLYKVIYNYRFIYMESTYLKKEYPKVRKKFSTELKMSSERILDYFEQMIKLGIWKREFSKDEYKQLFMQFLIISHNWIQYVQIDNNSPLSISKELARFAKISQSLFKPYLVETK